MTAKKQAANKEGLPVGEVISNAVKYYAFNQPCTAAQAMLWAALEDLSTGFAVDLNSYDPATHMIHISMTLLCPDNLPEDTLDWPNWLATTTIDLETTNYPDDWTTSVEEIPVSLKTIIQTCDANMHTPVLTDALLGTKVVDVEDVGTHRDSAMVASWEGNTTREENFISPGSEVTVKLLPKESYGVNAHPSGQGEGDYAYGKGGALRYIQSFGSMKHYAAANLAHQNV
jgi:hypothetical protein